MLLRATLLILLTFLGSLAWAADAVEDDVPTLEEQLFRPAEGADLNDFLWTNRPVIVFADSEADPRYRQQMELLSERMPDLLERDVIVIVDTDPAAQSSLRTRLRPRGFMFVLIGKDGNVYLRKPFPWDVRELSRSIDKMPMRQQELRDALRGG